MRPCLDSLGRGGSLPVQFLCDLALTASVQVSLINAANHLGLLRHDLRFAILALAVAQHGVIMEVDLAVFHGHADTEAHIGTEGLTFRLGEAAEQGDEELAGYREGIDVFLFEDNADASGLQHSYDLKAVHRISGEAGEGFCEDEVDPAALAGGDHAVEFLPLFHAGSRDPLISEQTSHLPIRGLLNFLAVVRFLGSVAVDLLLAVSANAAVGCYPLPAAPPGAARGGSWICGWNVANSAFLCGLYHGFLLSLGLKMYGYDMIL